LYILSNSHVLADEGTGAVGDRVIQPGKYDGGAAPGDVIAELRVCESIAASEHMRGD